MLAEAVRGINTKIHIAKFAYRFTFPQHSCTFKNIQRRYIGSIRKLTTAHKKKQPLIKSKRLTILSD